MRCSRFGRTVTIQEFYSFYLQNTECSNFYFSLVTTILFTHTGKNIPRKCFIFALHAPEIYIINFILHFERFFIYIYIFFLPLFLRSWKLLTKIANVSTRFKTLLPLTFDIPSYILRICAASRFSYFVPMSIANINKREILIRYNAQSRSQHAHRRLCTLLMYASKSVKKRAKI